MTMQQQLRKFAAPIATAALLALSGAAYAGTLQQAPETPVDCKKMPDDVRCQDQR